jgi:hypothetical protein
MLKLAALLFVCSAARAESLVATHDSWPATYGELRRCERSQGRRWVGALLRLARNAFPTRSFDAARAAGPQ